jgi:hypothetical protein
MNARLLLRVSVVALILVCASLSARFTAASAASRLGGLCPAKVSGPKWKNRLTGKSGTTYEVATLGSAFTCKTATVWVKKFIKEKAASDTAVTILKGGPKGYTCKANAEGGKTAARGSCLKLSGGAGKGFSWSPTG